MLRYVIGDRKPDLSFLLVKEDGKTPLADVASAEFKLEMPDGGVVTKSLTLDSSDPEELRATATFGVGELDESGLMFGEIVVTFTDGTVQHSKDALPVFVRAEFAEAQL